MAAPELRGLARIERLLGANPLVAGLGAEVVRSAAAQARLRSVRLGEHIWRAGARAEHFQVVVAGMVKLVDPGLAMRPTLFDVFGPGEALGYWVAYDGGPYIGDATPLTAHVETLLIPAAVLREATARDHAASLAMTSAALAHARALRAKLAVMCAGNVHQRLAALLLDLHRRFGAVAANGAWTIPVPLTRRDLSFAVGATLETVIRAMSRWQKQGVLETHAAGFTLRSPATLTAVRDDDASVEGGGVPGPIDAAPRERRKHATVRE